MDVRAVDDPGPRSGLLGRPGDQLDLPGPTKTGRTGPQTAPPGFIAGPTAQHDDVVAPLCQRHDERTSDEAGSAADDDSHCHPTMPERGDPSHLLQLIAPGRLSWGLMGVRAPALFVVSALLAAAVFSGLQDEDDRRRRGEEGRRWLTDDASPQAMAALGRLADSDPRAVAALEKRSSIDVNAYIAAWEAVTRGAPWGTTFLRTALADPTRSDTAATALPRRDPRLIPFGPDLEGAVVRLSAGHRGAWWPGCSRASARPRMPRSSGCSSTRRRAVQCATASRSPRRAVMQSPSCWRCRRTGATTRRASTSC